MKKVADINISNDFCGPYVVKLVGDDAIYFKIIDDELFFLLDESYLCDPNKSYRIVISIEDLIGRSIKKTFTINAEGKIFIDYNIDSKFLIFDAISAIDFSKFVDVGEAYYSLDIFLEPEGNNLLNVGFYTNEFLVLKRSIIQEGIPPSVYKGILDKRFGSLLFDGFIVNQGYINTVGNRRVRLKCAVIDGYNDDVVYYVASEYFYLKDVTSITTTTSTTTTTGSPSTSTTTTTTVSPCNSSIRPYRNGMENPIQNYGTYFIGTVTGALFTGKSVWGTNEYGYTDDSDLSIAAVHAGLISAGQTAQIKVTYLGTKDNFPSSVSNGISTQAWGGDWCAVALSLV